ncbi:VOC family protein [Streptomyces sp. N2A]|uniref:VOC family protein n=1 Tax=Streptomyces sp. N2A TaxID=3073936 RepID=UPI0028700E14|nr:VOC family protein [Streptomyces sp. N2A]
MASIRKCQVTYDCAEPERVARFWCEVVGYVVPPPPWRHRAPQPTTPTSSHPEPATPTGCHPICLSGADGMGAAPARHYSALANGAPAVSETECPFRRHEAYF